MKRSRSVALAMTLLLAAGMARASEPVQQLFQQWLVTCNNLNDCDVRNANPDDNIRVVLQYQAGPHGAISLELADYDSDRPKGIWIDGRPWNHQLIPQLADAQHDGAGYRSTSLAAIQQLLGTLNQAGSLALSDDSEEGTSLQGFNAALRFIDERQGRTDNRSALISSAKQASEQIPLRYAYVPPLPRLAKPIALQQPEALIKAVIASQQAVLNDEECTPEEETVAKSSAYPLDARRALVMINCVSGDYQSSSIIFITPRNRPQQAQALELPLPLRGENGEPVTINWFTRSSYHPQTGILTHNAQRGGIVGCGERAIWQFNGHSFNLMSYHNQPVCDGGPPENWPSVFLSPGFKEPTR